MPHWLRRNFALPGEPICQMLASFIESNFSGIWRAETARGLFHLSKFASAESPVGLSNFFQFDHLRTAGGRAPRPQLVSSRFDCHA